MPHITHTIPTTGGGGGAPTGAAGGELAGSYPNPTVADAVIDDANVVAGGLTNAALSATAAIAASKLAAIPESGITNLTTDLAAKAPLASPTFTGTPAAPTAAQGTNTTQVATTAMVHSEAVLLAPLASPTLTGTVTIPTPTTGDSSTKAASTAFVQVTAAAGETVLWPDGTFFPFPLSVVANAGGTTGAVNQGRTTRFVCPKTGTLTNLSIGITASSGNIDVGLYDTNDASTGNRTKLWTAGSTACGTVNTYQSFTPGIAVTAGKEYDFALSADNNTAAFLKLLGLPNIAFGTLPVAYNVVPGGATAKQYGLIASQFPLSTTTIAEASVTTAGYAFWFVGKIT